MRCADDPKCRFFEWFETEKKCNTYKEGHILAKDLLDETTQKRYYPGTFVLPSMTNKQCTHQEEHGFDMAKVKEC